MAHLYNIVLYQPLLNALIFFYNTIAFHDLGLAIIFLTILIRLILFPVFEKSARHQSIAQRLQPEIKRLQDLHKKDKQKQTEAIMALHKEHGINPFSGFFLILIQLPILIALFQIFRASLRPDFLAGLYPFMPKPDIVNTIFLDLIHLEKPSMLILGLAAIAQYFQGKLALPKRPASHVPNQAERVSRQMVFLGPVITILFFYRLSAAVNLYWFTTSLFSVFQQILINKRLDKLPAGKLKQIDNGQPGTINKKNN